MNPSKGNPEDIEVLCRYSYVSKEIRTGFTGVENEIRGERLFLDDRYPVLSVFDVTSMNLHDIKKHGIKYPDKKRKLPHKGFALLEKNQINNIKNDSGGFLNIGIDYNNNPPRHVDLTGWPHSVVDKKAVAKILGKRAIYFKTP